MFLLAGAAASVLDYLGSLHAASSALPSSAVAGAAASRPAFDIGSALAANDPSTAADGGGNWSSPATMDALISMQGQGDAATHGSSAASASSINLLERMIAQHAQLSTAASVGHSLSTFV